MNTQSRHDFDDFVDKDAMQDLTKKDFPTKPSFDWFVRCHRAQLVAAGAMILIAGRQRFHPVSFKKVAVEVGTIAASKVA